MVNAPKPSTTRLTVSFASGSMFGEASSRRSGVPQTVVARDARERSFTLRTVSARCAWYTSPGGRGIAGDEGSAPAPASARVRADE